MRGGNGATPPGCLMKTDTLFYRLFQDRPALVFEVAGLPRPGGIEYSLRAEEIKANEKKIFGWVAEGQSIHEITEKGGYF